MKEIFVATSNKNKLIEMNAILNENGIFDIKLLCPKDFNDNDEVIEDGQTFKENAYIKAKYYYDKYHYPTIGEDSGISIDHFNGLPGIYSARFLCNFPVEEKNNMILKMMEGYKDRKAHYTCTICFVDNDEAKYYVGEFYGEISTYQKIGFGFGYDSIFYLPEYRKNVSELEGVKNHLGHRYQAFSKFAKDIHE